MDFSLTEEQILIIETVKTFVEKELLPYEDEVERLNAVPETLQKQIKQAALNQGLYSANMPESLGGGGLNNLTMALIEKELGKASYALQSLVHRPSNILQACQGDQIENYLLPSIRGDKTECLAMTEPEAGSDLRSMKCSAVLDESNEDYIINGTKHFISHADIADFIILFAQTGVDDSDENRPRKKITAFLVDKNTDGLTVEEGYESVSHRGYHNSILSFKQCRVPKSNVLGEPDTGFDVANTWLAATRLSVAAICLGRAERALELAKDWACQRKQFGQSIGKFQGVSFKLADMHTQLKAAELLTFSAADKLDKGCMSDIDAAMAKLYSTEALAFIADNALQIFGGMGLMKDLPLERIWRDARVERIWDGTSEIQRHIIGRNLLRPLGG